MGAELPRPDARATAAGYTWSHQVGRPGCCLMAQVWAPDGRSVATIEPTDDPAIASHRAEVCALALGGAGATAPAESTASRDEIWTAIEFELRSCIDDGTSPALDELDCLRLLALMATNGLAAPAQADPMPAGERQVLEQLLAKARSVIATIEPESLAEHERLQQLIAGIDAVTDPVARSDLFAGGGL